MERQYLNLNQYDKYDLWTHTDNHLERKKISLPRQGNFYPSEASVVFTDKDGDKVTEGGCLRKSFYRLKGIEGEPVDARTELIFAEGKGIEQILVEQWKEMGIWVANNVEFFTRDYGFPLKGELDCILKEPHSGKLYFTEVKTFYGYYATKEIMGNRREPGFPKMSQLLQTLIYTYHFRDRFYCGRLVYLARDEPANRRTFKVELHQEGDNFYPKVEGEVIRLFTIDDVLKRYRQLYDYLSNDEVPPRDYELQYSNEKIEDLFKRGKLSKAKYEDFKKGERVGDWNCAWCGMCKYCYSKASV